MHDLHMAIFSHVRRSSLIATYHLATHLLLTTSAKLTTKLTTLPCPQTLEKTASPSAYVRTHGNISYINHHSCPSPPLTSASRRLTAPLLLSPELTASHANEALVIYLLRLLLEYQNAFFTRT